MKVKIFDLKKYDERITLLENNQKDIIELNKSTEEMLQRISGGTMLNESGELMVMQPDYLNKDIRIEMPANPEIQKIEIIEKEKPIVEKYTLRDKYRAAYALNLLTVSVSQIVAYNDLHILDQEYDMILNNLNLEMMPKDEALLSTFKQLLDTITFFKIQDGDKKQLEKKYQQKMKAAIWSATPNFGVIMTGSGGNPYAAAAILATQIGIGYMNYRKEKAKVKAEHEEEAWKLQRSAMEQFNALRRELFDTAWRIADEYDFKDEWRLVEKQIDQYNEILMDTNSMRRYERLYAVKDAFVAYPHFWYYLAKSAKEVAEEHNSLRDSVYNQYMELARTYYEYFINMVTEESDESDQMIRFTGLLREDQIAASAFLEYVGLEGIEVSDAGQFELISKAKKIAGHNNDTIQLCALGFLRLTGCNDNEVQNKAFSETIETLKYLINEGYNATGNAQLLSTVYVQLYISNKDEAIYNAYSLLSERIEEQYLFPLPEEDLSYEELQKQFIDTQKYILAKKYAYALKSFSDKYVVLFNRVIPLPNSKKEYGEEFYLDSLDSRTERYNLIKEQFKNTKKQENYVATLKEIMIFNQYLEIFNDMYKALRKLEFVDDTDSEILSSFCGKIEEKQGDVDRNLTAMHGDMYTLDKFTDLYNLNFSEFTMEFWKKVCYAANEYVGELDTMEKISKAESNLWELCIQEGLDEPEILFEHSGSTKHYLIDRTFISPSLLGTQVEAAAELLDRKNKMKEVFVNKIEELKDINYKKQDKIEILKPEDTKFKWVLRAGINSGTRFKEKAFGIIYDSRALAISLIFTTDGIAVIKGKKINNSSVPYDTIDWGKNGKELLFDSSSVKGVNQKQLKELIDELCKQLPNEKEEAQSTSNGEMNKKTQLHFDVTPKRMQINVKMI